MGVASKRLWKYAKSFLTEKRRKTPSIIWRLKARKPFNDISGSR
jgi:hypothetical protein